MPKVSVIIPAYNAAKTLKTAVRSVTEQTFQDFEVIIVNDGSKDETLQISQSLSETDHRLKVMSQTNSGVSETRNTGIRASGGDYIALLDADDLWEPTKLEKQVRLLDENPDVGLCFTAMQRVDENLQPLNRVAADYYEDYTEALLLYLCVVTGSCSSAMLRRGIIEKAGDFDAKFSTAADWEYWLRVSLLTKFAPIPEYLVKYRVASGSMSSDPYLVRRDMLGVLEKFFTIEQLPEKYRKMKDQSYSNNLMILSGEFLHAGKPAESLSCLLKGLRLHPRNIARPLGLPLRWTKRVLSVKT